MTAGRLAAKPLAASHTPKPLAASQRFAALAAFTLGVLWVSPSRADLPVAPPPREVRPDGTRDPVPQPEATSKENPLEVVERIIRNSKDVGDKLADTDTGTDTRKTQEKILKDIDALLNQDDPPPKDDMNKDMKDDQKDDMKQDSKQDMKDDKKDMKQDMMPMNGMNDPKKDMQPMGGMNMPPMPMGGDGGGNEPKKRRPRQGEEKEKDAGGKPKDPGKTGGGNQQKPMQPMGGKPKDPKGGQTPDPNGNAKNPPGRPLLPTEEDVVKDVWGHLPDKLRQQATQYYKQEFMPRYAELLKQYYSTLAEKK